MSAARKAQTRERRGRAGRKNTQTHPILWIAAAGVFLALLPAFAWQHRTAGDQPGTRVSEPIAPPTKLEREENGLTLRVPDTHRQLGRVYFVLPGHEPQVRIRSDAPLEEIHAQSDRVIGYAVAAPVPADAEFPRPLLAGEFHLPVASINTHNELRNKHLQERGWLDAASHPDIVFHLERFKPTGTDPHRDPAGGTGPMTYRGTIVGVMTMRGVSRRLEIDDAALTYLPESSATRPVAPGDLLMIRCRYAIRMQDFGVNQSIIGVQVAEWIVLDQVLYLSTVPPNSELRER